MLASTTNLLSYSGKKMSFQKKNLLPFRIKPEPEPDNNEDADADADVVRDDLVDHESTPQSGKSTRTRWSTHETTTLCKSWESVITGNYVGTNHTRQQYWQKVSDCYNELRGEGNPRSLCQCKNYFSKMSKAVAKFSRAFNHALAIKQSGWSDEDVIKKAHNIYEGDEGKRFTVMEAWQILRIIPKWWTQYVETNQNSTSSGSKTSHLNESGDYSNSSSNAETSSSAYPTRPPGIIATKKKEKRVIKEDLYEELSERNRIESEFSEKLDRYMKLAQMRLEEDKKNRLFKQWEFLMKKENKSPEEEEDCTKLYRELFK